MKSITLKKHFIVLAVMLATSLTAWADNVQSGQEDKHYRWNFVSDSGLLFLYLLEADTNNNWDGVVPSYSSWYNVGEGHNPFYDISSQVKTIQIGGGIKQIGSWTFGKGHFPNLEKVIIDSDNLTLKDGAVNEGSGCFAQNTKLAEVEMSGNDASGKTLTIGTACFSGCTGLKTFYTKGANVTVGASAFSGSGLETFYNSSSALYVTNLTLQNVAFGGASKLKAFSISSSSDITIPYNAFQNCTSLEYFITWGGKVTVGNGAFEGCTSLKSISSITGVGITSVGSKAFSGCTSLESFTASAALTSIGTYAFENCTGMKYVDLRKAKYNTLKLNGGTRAYINRDEEWCSTMSKGAFIYAPSDYSGGYSGKNIVIAGTGDYAGKLVCQHCYFYDGMAVGFPSEGKFTAINNGIHYERSVEHGKYYTVCLPYKIDFGSCYTLKGVTGNTIEFEEVEYANREANKPYVFYNYADTRTSIYTSGGVEVGGTADHISKGDYGLWGNFGETIDAAYLTTHTANNYYILQSDGMWKLFDGSNDAVNIPPTRAYITVKKNAGAPAMLASDFGGGSTGIGDLTPSLSEGEEVWYDLQGRSIEGRPMQKGVYIVGGKKIIVK